MSKAKKLAAPSMLSLGIVFLLIGFVQQDFRLSFESGMFNLGLIFTLSGLVAAGLEKKYGKPAKEDEGPLGEAFKEDQDED